MAAGTPGALPQPPASAAYLGQGIKYPLAYDPNTGRLLLSNGLTSVADALSAILQTAPGERPMQPDFGANVGTFEPVNSGRIKAVIEQVIADHEPRVKSVDIQIDLGPDTNTQQLTVRYEVAGQANPQFLTYPIFKGPA